MYEIRVISSFHYIDAPSRSIPFPDLCALSKAMRWASVEKGTSPVRGQRRSRRGLKINKPVPWSRCYPLVIEHSYKKDTTVNIPSGKLT